MKTYWFFFSRNLEPFLSQIRSTVYHSALPAYLDHSSPLPPLPNRTALQQSKHLQHPRRQHLLYLPLKQHQNPQNKCVYKKTNRRFKTTVSAWTNFNLVVCFCLLIFKQLSLFLGDCKNISWDKTVHQVECSQDLILAFKWLCTLSYKQYNYFSIILFSHSFCLPVNFPRWLRHKISF